MAVEFSAVFWCTNSSRASRRSSSVACGNRAVRRSPSISSPLQEEAYPTMSLLRPSNHCGQLSDRSLFCGTALGPPTALAPTFHWLPSWRLCQWQWPHDLCVSSAYDCVKNQRSPTSSSVLKRFSPFEPELVGSGVLPVTPTATKPWRVSLPFWSTPRNDTSS